MAESRLSNSLSFSVSHSACHQNTVLATADRRASPALGNRHIPAPADYVCKGPRRTRRIETETQLRRTTGTAVRKAGLKAPTGVGGGGIWLLGQDEHSLDRRVGGGSQLRAAASLRPAPCSGAADRAPPAPRAVPGGPAGHWLVRHSAVDPAAPNRPRDTQLTC